MFNNNLIMSLSKVARCNLITRNAKLLHISSSRLSKPTSEETTDEPIQFSTSKAARWSVRNTVGEPFGHKEKPPAGQAYVVALSTIVFLVYFCILREENDIDENLYKPLSERGITFKVK